MTFVLEMKNTHISDGNNKMVDLPDPKKVILRRFIGLVNERTS